MEQQQIREAYEKAQALADHLKAMLEGAPTVDRVTQVIDGYGDTWTLAPNGFYYLSHIVSNADGGPDMPEEASETLAGIEAKWGLAEHEHRASCHGAVGELQCGYPA